MAGAKRLDIGDVLGGFKIERELGRGGMGVVYKGHELSLNRMVALKVLSERLCSDEEFIKRFKREAQVIAVMNHPNIVNILSYGESEGLYYFAMEYVQGRDLGQILKEKGSLPLEEALSIGAQVAGALAEAGSRGIVHRDLKPSNIMMDGLGRAKVTDFGVAHYQGDGAKLTQTGLFLGTPEYASPEQATGKPLDVRSDIYALGAVMYRMLSGRPPITGESPLAVVTKIATETITPIGQINKALPKSVCDLIDKMMAKPLTDRFQSPAEVVTAIARCTEELERKVPIASPTIKTVAPKPPKLPRKSSVRLWGGIVGVALAVLLIVWLVEGGWQKDRSVNQKAEEETRAPAAVEKTEPDEVQATLPATVGKTQMDTVESAPPAVEPVAKPADKILPATAEPMTTAKQSPHETQIAALGGTPKKEMLPSVPTVLMIVTGHEGMAPLLQTHLESVLMESGFPVASVVDIPSLEEKMRIGNLPITWHSVRQFVPKERAQILLLAQVEKTGSTQLNYYGRVQEMTTATFSVKAVDAASGTAVARSISGSVQYTQLNMDENIRTAVTTAAGNMGEQMKGYWNKKLQDSKKG